ncbi:HAMP domain-containing sensor histidine kinase [Paenibacillus wynnii]|uniref:HAMP domain-containing sensor histidine kinase n=1 Tax=Paenibacillus wynnii TaxID=268407 RepID=UPI00279167A2|nr:HAMP domain-containing sensor histidine kinase [Paenibacillus wynnii]MDQ0194818.1 signal transduction histidine kinase [Paenibacillus wynnii]
MLKKLLIVLLIAVLATSTAYLLLLLNVKEGASTDRIAINGIVKLTVQNWGALKGNEYGNTPYDFAIIDASGTLLYQTKTGIAVTVNEAINNRDTLIDIVVDDQHVGKVIINNDYNNVFLKLKQQFSLVFAASIAMLFLLCLVFILYLDRTIFRPFRKMQLFARHIAKGDLNIPLEMDHNHMFGAFTESFDMMREELAAARHNEYLANKSKKELVATLSHDIRTPVSSIKAITELMLLKTTDEKNSRQLNTLYSKADQIDHLVTDMFHATMEELNELQVNVTDELSSLLDAVISNANYYEHIKVGTIPECIISVDSLRLQQVIDNVVNNSLKYARTSIDIISEIREGFLEVDIMDYGPGVPDEELPLLFNKFFRGSRVGAQSGSGLGLYISRYMLRKMQGDMIGINRQDGFTMKLLIPLAGKS